MPFDPKLCILGIPPDNFVTSKCENSLLDICLLEARRCIARSWKEVTVEGISQWLRGMVLKVAVEKMCYFAKNKIDKFWSTWKIFYDYLEQNNIVVETLDN